MTTHLYDGCPDCQERMRSLLATPPLPRPREEKKPTAERLERHAARFGSEGVEEVARQEGIEVTVEKHRGPSVATRRARRRRSK